MARETWFVLEDGNVVDPAECSDVEGALTHESGVKVAMRMHDCPMSRGIDADAERAKGKKGGDAEAKGEAKPKEKVDSKSGEAKETKSPNDRQMQSGAGKGYETR
jgi:chromatin remodeling complex protein RSC6